MRTVNVYVPDFCIGDIGWIIAASREHWSTENREKHKEEREQAFYRRLGIA